MVVAMLIGTAIVFFAHICFYKEYGVLDYYLFADFNHHLLICAAILFVSMLGTYAAHLLGYLICGSLSGYKLISIEIYGFIFRQKSGKLTVEKYNGRSGIYVNMAPPEFADGHFPFALYNVGAIVAFITVSLIALSVVLFYFFADVPLVALYWFCVFIWFFWNAVLYLLPVECKSISVLKKNRLLKSSYNIRRAFWNANTVYAELKKGTRLREQPAELFILPSQEEMVNSISAEIAWLKLNRLLDEESFEKADKLVDFIISDRCELSDFKKNIAVLDKIYIELINSCRPDVIESLLREDIRLFMQQNSKFITVVRTELALALLYYKDIGTTADYRVRFSECIKNEPYPANISAEIDLVNLAERIASE